MRLHKILITIAALVALSIGALVVLPWQGWVQQKLIRMLEAKGFASPALTIDHIGLRGVVLKDVTVGEPPLKLASLTVVYDPRAVIKGQINDIEITGLNLQATQTDAGWQVDGLDNLSRKQQNAKAATIPVTLAQLHQLPFRSITIHDSVANVSGNGWQAQIPLEGKLVQGAEASIHLESKGMTASFGANAVAVDAINLDLKLDDAKQQWDGNWAMGSIAVTSETLAVPPLRAKGELSLTSNSINAAGTIDSADKFYGASFSSMISIDNAAASLMKIIAAKMPLSGGSVAVHGVSIPLSGTKPIALTLEVNKVAIDSMMQTLTGSRATATGAVSGKVPLRIARDGTLQVGKSSLMADAPGVIALSPDAIPGDNQQVALVREVLKNLHYTLLAVNLDMSPGGNLNATLAVEGRNPDVEKGRAVKLQVHLSGDLLNLITQNLKLITDPKQFIEQSTHEKH